MKGEYVKSISINWWDVDIELNLRSSKTVICGNSASGKTYMCELLRDYVYGNKIDNMEVVADAPSKSEIDSLKDNIKKSKNKVYILDNSDELFREYPELFYLIRHDFNNQYIAIGRDFSLLNDASNLAKMDISNNKVKIAYLLPKAGFR